MTRSERVRRGGWRGRTAPSSMIGALHLRTAGEPDPTLEWGALPAEWLEGPDTVRLWLTTGPVVLSVISWRFARERVTPFVEAWEKKKGT